VRLNVKANELGFFFSTSPQIKFKFSSCSMFNVQLRCSKSQCPQNDPATTPFTIHHVHIITHFFFFLLTLAFIIYIPRIWIPRIGRLHAYKEQIQR